MSNTSTIRGMNSWSSLRWSLALTLAAVAPIEAAGAAPAPKPDGPGARRIETVAGTGTRGYSGDGGSARSAMFFEPTHVALDPAGNLYVSDTMNHRASSGLRYIVNQNPR